MRVFRLFLFSIFVVILAGRGAEGYGWAQKDAEHMLARDTRTGIKEIIPADARKRYQSWKDELLSTDFGRQQWNSYADRKDFLLTIVVASDRKHGAGTDDFEWDKDGNLVAARITLGKNLDKGFPDPIYYPVMNSLATYDGLYEVDGDILASTKMIHELGHVNFTAETNAKLFQKQNKLMAAYNNIFLKNGYNTSDPRLVALATELGANPIEIWEDREFRSEVSAMRYLVERMGRESSSCSVFHRMERNIAGHGRNYFDKLGGLVDAGRSSCRN